MFSFFDSGVYLQSGFMMVLFLLSTVNMCMLPNLFFREYKTITKIITIFFNIAGWCVTVPCTAGLFAVFKEREVPRFCMDVMENSVFIVPFAFANLVFIILIGIGEYTYRKNSVSTLSIKEGFDHLPTGLCFADENGTVQLANHKINELSYVLTGEELQNANIFWDVVSHGKLLAGVQRLENVKQPVIMLEDGTVYSFSRERVENVFQITASDVTGLYRLTNRLQDKNDELEEMNIRLRKYGETVDETTRARERLETKMRIHSELGQALLATHHYLRLPDSDLQPVLNSWKRNIFVLRAGAEPQSDSDPLRTLINLAEAAGVSFVQKGSLPPQTEISNRFVMAATEALTNAVRHADAKTLYMEISESDDFYIASFANDGNKPSGEICEGGGLSSLRKKTERSGGEMEILYSPGFVLKIKLPKEVYEL